MMAAGGIGKDKLDKTPFDLGEEQRGMGAEDQIKLWLGVTDSASGIARDDWVPGDEGYIRNDNFLKGVQTNFWKGDNIIYLGQRKFWAMSEPASSLERLENMMRSPPWTRWSPTFRSWPYGIGLPGHLTDGRIWSLEGLTRMK